MAARFGAIASGRLADMESLESIGMHTCIWMCVFLGFCPLAQIMVLGSSWSGLADSCTCAQTIRRRFEKLAESVAEVVQRSRHKKEKASQSGHWVSPIVTKVSETQLGDGSLSASPPVRPQSLVYNLSHHFHTDSLG